MAEVGNLHGCGSASTGLALNSLGVGSNLLLLGCNQSIGVLFGSFLSCSDVFQVLFHTILDLLEHANDLATLRHIALANCRVKEGHDHVLLIRIYCVRVDNQAFNCLCCICLQEAALHATANGSNSLREGIYVHCELLMLLGELCGLLATQALRLSYSCHSIFSGCFVLLQMFFQLCLLTLGLLQGSLQLWHLCLSCRDALLQCPGRCLTIAHVLVKELLLLLSLSLHLGRHGL
mmetsp:Transcript_13593/g.30948  ORF Transcript_13593/g.30948 Transcript_13593/m.30948 type:complete len:234 (+) Transcript_13593:1383-2084(+)